MSGTMLYIQTKAILALQHFTKATNMIRFLNLVSFVMLMCHWNACLQFLAAVLLEFPPESWAVLEEVEVVPFFNLFPILFSASRAVPFVAFILRSVLLFTITYKKLLFFPSLYAR